MKKSSLIAMIFFLASRPAYSVAPYADFGFTTGYSQGSIATDATPAELGIFGAGATLGLSLGYFALGVSTDYRFANQYSPLSDRVGNFAGYRWNNISPTLVGQTSWIVVKLDAEFLGAYHLRYQTLQAENVDYASPLGWRISVLFPYPRIPGYLIPGVFYESLMFRTQNSSNLGQRDLGPPFKMQEMGISVSIYLPQEPRHETSHSKK